MPIATPGPRLLRRVPLRFVARRAAGGGKRPVTTSLSLTSMIDFLVVTVVFLLIAFQPGESAAADGIHLPPATNVADMLDAPMISVAGGQVLIDGALVGNTRTIEETKHLETIEGLARALVAKRDTWKELHPNKPFPGVVVLRLDQDVSSVVVKSLFQTATRSGYPAISFMVQRGS